MKEYRLIDANKNRVAEGIRVLEDLSRFVYDNKELTDKYITLKRVITRKHKKVIRELEHDPEAAD